MNKKPSTGNGGRLTRTIPCLQQMRDQTVQRLGLDWVASSVYPRSGHLMLKVALGLSLGILGTLWITASPVQRGFLGGFSIAVCEFRSP